MLISSIDRLKGNLFEVKLDDEYSVNINSAVFSKYNIKVGAEITEELLDEAVYASDYYRAKEKALYLLDYRDHTYKEMFLKLEKNYPEQVCYDVVDYLAGVGLIDDRRYAENYIRKLAEVKKYGTYKIKAEMKNKGISEDIIEELILGYEDDYGERLREIIEKKFVGRLTDRKSFDKAVASLLRMGYSYSEVKPVLSEYMESCD